MTSPCSVTSQRKTSSRSGRKPDPATLAVFADDPPALSEFSTDLGDELVGHGRPVVEPHGKLADLEGPFSGPIADRRRNPAASATHDRLRPVEPWLDEPSMEIFVKADLQDGHAGGS